jgi:5-methyltetrahydrofolate--homocysteine methyltransferase
MVDQLLDAGAVGINVTDGYQFEPEQTTAALVVLHPDARYYALAMSGNDE